VDRIFDAFFEGAGDRRIVGGLIGLIFGSVLEPIILTIVAGFLGTVVASVIRNTLLVSAWDYAGIADTGTPVPIVVKAAIASLAGSLAADRLAQIVGDLPSIVLWRSCGFALSSAARSSDDRLQNDAGSSFGSRQIG
jgi:hypothetical protein